jgi:hypothetical protein
MFNISIISLSIFNVNRLIAFPYEIAKCSEKRQDMPESAAPVWWAVVGPVTRPCFMFDFSSESL